MKPRLCIIILSLLVSATLFADSGNDISIKKKCLDILAKSMTYTASIYTDAGINNSGDSCGYFKATNAGMNNEDGVRTNADMAMVCAFVYNYGKKNHIVLPAKISYPQLRTMALKALRYAYSTHRALQLKKTTNNGYWGTSIMDADGKNGGYTWESSLWCESIGMTAWLLKDCIPEKDWLGVMRIIQAEADHELTRDIPTGFDGDTKAEENGWETNVLAMACALYPNSENANRWYDKMRAFAFNCYTVAEDSTDNTIIDGQPARKWYRGQNLYDDFTLQNHNYFHTSYQNVVIQELSESLLILKMIQGNEPKFKTSETLLWHQKDVFDKVLKELALHDGELAMPNGNDWSMFLYDQLTAYTAMATIFRDADALMLEKAALTNIQKRQNTTTNGAWMLNPDIGARRMGVTAHRVMMTYLMHDTYPVGNMRPTEWNAFTEAHSKTVYFPSQKIVRGMTKDKFTCFSWSKGLNDYTGIIIPNDTSNNNLMVPYKTHGTGNMLGYYNDLQSTASGEPVFDLHDEEWSVSGALKAAGGKIKQYFYIWSTPGNAVAVIEKLVPEDSTVVLTQQKGGLMAVSVDPFTRSIRNIYSDKGLIATNGAGLKVFNSDWVNIDNKFGIVCKYDNSGKQKENEMAFGDRTLTNSIYTAKIYPAYSDKEIILKDSIIRMYVYYPNITANATRQMTDKIKMKIKGDGTISICVPDTYGFIYKKELNFNF